MSTRQRVRERRDEILRVAARHGAGNVRLFGSVARGEDMLESDVDLLVDVTGATTPWVPGRMAGFCARGLAGKQCWKAMCTSLSTLPVRQPGGFREAWSLTSSNSWDG